MNRPLLIAIAAAAMAAGIAGCKSPASIRDAAAFVSPTDVEQLASTSGLTSTELAQARRVYLNKCARCHKFYDPGEYADDEWRLWMQKMSRKARLQPDQEQLLTRYLNAFRSDN